MATKLKAAPRDYEADLRFAAPPETAGRKELLDRAHELTKLVVSDGALRHDRSQSK